MLKRSQNDQLFHKNINFFKKLHLQRKLRIEEFFQAKLLQLLEEAKDKRKNTFCTGLPSEILKNLHYHTEWFSSTICCIFSLSQSHTREVWLQKSGDGVKRQLHEPFIQIGKMGFGLRLTAVHAFEHHDKEKSKKSFVEMKMHTDKFDVQVRKKQNKTKLKTNQC